MATWPTVTNDDGSGTTGTILDQTLFNSIRDYIGAAWTSVTFNAGNFTASGSMTWTVASGDVNTFDYVEIGKTMIVSCVLSTTTVGGTPSTALKITIPNGRTAGNLSSGPVIGLNNGSQFNGFWQVNGGTVIDLYVDATAGTNWTASTNNTQIRLLATFEIA